MSAARLRGLYLIAGSGLDVATARSWLLPGVALVQYRNKCADQNLRLKEARQLCALCKQRKVGFIVNDDLELAMAVGADGVHLGRNDPEVLSARRMLGEKFIIGASCYDSMEHALAAQLDSADYVAFGALFVSLTKPEAVPVTPARLAEYKRRLVVPVCAIGGIRLENLDRALATGADLIAVNAAIAHADDPRTTVEHFINKIGRAHA